MGPIFEKSLLLRLGLAMATITALAFISMLSSVIIAETTQGAAAAINQAGSLRMQSYRIATDLVYSGDMDAETYWKRTETLVEEFETRLNSPRLRNILPHKPEHKLQEAYDHITRQWSRTIRPVLEVYIAIVAPRTEEMKAEHPAIARATRNNIRERYVTIVDRFVENIDHFVKLLEDNAESKIQLLRLVQVVSVFLTLAVVFITMYLMHTNVLVPLRDLLACAESARRGDFTVRTRHESDDELGRLGHAFNVMAEDLSKMYTDLEERVREKTADLERSNRYLELLYNTAKRLNEAPMSDETYHQILRDIEGFVGIGPGTICIAEPGANRAYRLANTRGSVAQMEALCGSSGCERCLGEGSTRMFDLHGGEKGQPRTISIPVKDKDQQYGVLMLEVPRDTTLATWQIRLLEAVARHIAIAINVAQRTTQDRRLALLEERNVIARELHDSLAQSLSYLKIQASRLEMTLRQSEGNETARAVVKEIRDGISSAYRQLRELLTTFRLKMDGRGLATALEETVHEFRERSGLAITLENQLVGRCQLSANEEIHILQVVREALSNVVRHAHADQADIRLACRPEGEEVVVQIDDDGIGIPEQAERRHHYGVAIMSERAHSLNGRLTLSQRPGGGTRAELVFTPINRSIQSKQTREGIVN